MGGGSNSNPRPAVGPGLRAIFRGKENRAKAGPCQSKRHWHDEEIRRSKMTLRKFVIEREIPRIGTADREQLRAAAAKSNGVLRELGPDIQWVESYVTDDKIFCVYLASNEGMIRKHAEMS